MSNDFIFWTQIASIVTFIFVVFGIYRLLIDQKDSTIQLLKEMINSLKDQLSEALNSTPDVLAQSLSKRVNILKDELERLIQDKNTDQNLVLKKEEELRATRQTAEELKTQIALARELVLDFICPLCGAPLATREYHSELIEYQGRELDLDHDFSKYVCGYSTLDGEPYSACDSKNPRNFSATIQVDRSATK